MKKLALCLLTWIVGSSVLAENVKLNGIYYSLGTTTAQVISDQSSDKSAYKNLTEVTIPASVNYNNYNPAQKLIRNGNVYILRDEHIYTINGATIQ